MAVKVARKYLQLDKYDYVWTLDKGYGEYTGIFEQANINKDEGYEVLYFIQKFMNKHKLISVDDVIKIEDALHHPALNAEVGRDKLMSQIEAALGFSNVDSFDFTDGYQSIFMMERQSRGS